MKTPRELLLDQHRDVEPKLDAIREHVVDSLADSSGAPSHNRPPGVWLMLRERARSLRWHFAAMSAAWIVVVLLNIDHSTIATARVVKENLPSPRQLLAALRENRRQIFELTEEPLSEPLSVPHSAVPQRRSELQCLIAFA